MVKNNIVLIGFMGTGKTSVGKRLESTLKMEFIDTDSIIEQKLNLKISEIFANYGEDYFRNIETEVAKEVSVLNNKIISTGGGIVLRKDNIMFLKKNGVLILLEASENTIYERLKNKTDRPLLKVDNPIAKIKELLNFRKELYISSADIIINTDNKTISEISNEILKKLKELNFI